MSEPRTPEPQPVRSPADPPIARQAEDAHSRNALLATALLLAIAIFIFDTFSPLEGAVAVLYVVVVVLAARTGRRRDIVVAAAGTLALTLYAYFDTHGAREAGAWTLRAIVSIAAIVMTGVLALQGCAATAALVRSESRYRRIFDASRIGIIEQDWRALRSAVSAQGLPSSIHRGARDVAQLRSLVRTIDTNPAMLAMLRRGADAEGLRAVSDRFFADTRDAFVRGEMFVEGESELLRSDGSRTPFLYTVIFPPPDDPDGSVLVFIVDITERRQAQDALLAAQADLAHAARTATLGELSASIAHEVNQPLMAVVTDGQAGLRWLRRATPDLAEVEQALTRIVAEGNRAGQIVTRIRSFVKKMPAQHEVLSIATIIEDAVLLVERELLATQVELKVEIAPDLPMLRGDRIQLQQILVNLMVNAAQALAASDTPRRLRVAAGLEDSGRIAVCVEDNGPGIGPGEQSRIFEPFFTTRQAGMGMGLAICRTTAEAHGGRLSVDSVPGAGAAFHLILPVAALEDAET
ncbi:hypothetical protein Rmf_42890 [Roseomonas fluvialis]|uniref:histidine kinase n=1 Tax=Roseomonas fluvialis TaxID=1750527 RepID=A0ABM7Y8K4_9PROT|nr:hypothetical protein Rmf_42890 [Roseomonas fluvialis]